MYFGAFTRKLATVAAMVIASICISTTVAAQEDNVDDTYDQESIVDSASNYLGEGAEIVAKALEGVFAKLGRPNAYITGSEAGG